MKSIETWSSERLGQEVTVARWGHFGTPVLLFPTAGGDAEEVERFLMIDALGELLRAGTIKVYSLDSVAGRAWLKRDVDPRHSAWLQNRFDAFVAEEVVPLIRTDSGGEQLGIIAAGASIGAFNAVASLCRHPDLFSIAIGMSGTYDLERWLHGHSNRLLYFSSPLHFLPNLEDGEQLRTLRRRFVLLPTGEGRWEDPSESWRMAHVLGARGIPNRVDPWGPEWNHDWTTWRAMLPRYLAELAARGQELA